tara:strand:+ start:201 stop:581 length:381 start_codon:yes stop_codon:yes gene_type:complete
MDKIKASHKFVSILSIISIIGFIGIISKTLFGFDLSVHVEAFWMIIIGLGFLFETNVEGLKNISSEGLTSNNFAHLITATIGVLAFIAGIFSLPGILVESSAFVAIKGILAVIAIIVIIVQTWLVE